MRILQDDQKFSSVLEVKAALDIHDIVNMIYCSHNSFYGFWFHVSPVVFCFILAVCELL